MFDLLDLDKVRAIGPRKFLVCFALAISMLFFGLFIAVGVLFSGPQVADRGLLIVSLGFGVVMTAVFGRRIWRLASE